MHGAKGSFVLLAVREYKYCEDCKQELKVLVGEWGRMSVGSQRWGMTAVKKDEQ